MKTYHYICVFFLALSCQSQTGKAAVNSHVGGPFEGCEAIYEYGNKVLKSTDTLPKFESSEPKLKINGTVFLNDGKTPAENVILYIYHTNQKGIYETKGNETGWAKRHGYIRGWVKTDKAGAYTFYTFKPASYPNGQAPKHIHIMVKEPNKHEYYIDDFMFKSDPFLTNEIQNGMNRRGGSGIVKPVEKNGLLVIERDIILGLNVPDYN